MKVFGLIGEAGCGKSTVGNYLCEKYGFATYSFARPLKELCCRIFGWDMAELEHLEYKEAVSGHDAIDWTLEFCEALCEDQGIDTLHADHLLEVLYEVDPSWTRRRILQVVGTEAFRGAVPDHWCNKGLEWLQNALDAGTFGVVIPDMRFLNEVDAIQEFGGCAIRVVRTGEYAGTKLSSHSSEQEWTQIIVGAVIKSGNGIDVLHERVDAYMATLG